MKYPYADGDKVFVKHCPGCGADLTEVGVSGDQIVDFRATPSEEDLEYGDTWESKDMEYAGAIILCSKCWTELGRSGNFRRDQQAVEVAIEFLNEYKSRLHEEALFGDAEAGEHKLYLVRFISSLKEIFCISDEESDL